MSAATVTPPHVTESARAHLAGRPVHVRASRRHGCCGGTAAVPVAEPGEPESLDGIQRFEVDGTVVYVDRTVFAANGGWTIDTDGFARWRRLVVLGLGLTPG